MSTLVVTLILSVLCLVAGCDDAGLRSHAQETGPAGQGAAVRAIRVDVSPDFRRNDTGAPHWEEWQVPNGRSSTREIQGVTVTLRQAVSGAAPLEGQWSKVGLAAGTLMACDGVFAPDGAIEIVLEGLSPGRHTLVTYHNSVWDEDLGPYVISVDSRPMVRGLTPSRQMDSDEDASSGFVALEAQSGVPVVVRIDSARSGQADKIILNGIEIDGQDPARQARKPVPSHGDLHTNGDRGSVELAWTPGADAVRHRVFVASHRDPEQAAAAVAASSDPLATVRSARCAADIADRDSLLTYCWRVDEIDAQGHVTPGDVWSFRVRHLAFPEAEGYGRFALGGRAGKVLHVTHLNDSGPGSLREAVEADGPRTVVFDVGGLISLESRLVFRNPFLTVAGQTAPGKGICVRNYTFGGLGARDTVIRHVRLRLGDLAGKTMDGMGLASCDHCILDHCSISWTQDEAFSSRGARNITLQRSLISEALNVAGHANYAPGTGHGYAASIGGDVGTFHHNLLAHCAGRNWSLAGGLDKAGRHTGDLDIRNNVVYNWGHNNAAKIESGARANLVGNCFIAGPDSTEAEGWVFLQGPELGTRVYLEGNVAPPASLGSGDQWAGTAYYEQVEGRWRGQRPAPDSFRAGQPFAAAAVVSQSAADAYQIVLARAGARARDADDLRVIEDVRARTGHVGRHGG